MSLSEYSAQGSRSDFRTRPRRVLPTVVKGDTSATDPILGQGKVLLGPTAVLLEMPGHWVIGVLVNNQWSVGGNPLRQNVNFSRSHSSTTTWRTGGS